MSLNLYRTLKKAGIEILAADPVTELFEGRLFYNSTTNALRIYESAAWVDVVAASAPSLATDNVFIGNAGTATEVNTAAVGDIAATVASGLKIKSKDSGNAIINGGFDVWQRTVAATPITTIPAYLSCDLWRFYHNNLFSGNPNVIRSTITGTGGIGPKSYYACELAGVANFSTCEINMIHRIESLNATQVHSLGSDRSVSFWFYSNGPDTVTFNFSRANATNGFAGVTAIHSETISGLPLNQWVFVEFKNIANGGNFENFGLQLEFIFKNWVTGSTKRVHITDVMFAQGSGNRFTRATGSIEGEVTAVRRYFQSIFYERQAGTGFCFGSGFMKSSSTAQLLIEFPVLMRTPPTLTTMTASLFSWRLASGTNSANWTAISPLTLNNGSVILDTTGAASTNAQGYATMGVRQSVSAQMFLSSELL